MGFGDALAAVWMERSGISPEQFAINHPAGALGRQLTLTIADLMVPAHELPPLAPEAPLATVISHLNEGNPSRGSLGASWIQASDAPPRLAGLITDGDLRRTLQHHGPHEWAQITAAHIATPDPITIHPSELAAAALQLMERNRRKAISMLPVISASERDLVLRIAEEVSGLCSKLGIDYVFKANFDKANRSSGKTFRGPGAEEGLANLAEVGERFGVPVFTDIDESHQASVAAQAVDVPQIPAFLCRQTDLLEAAVKAVADTDKVVNVKESQFLAPWDMTQVVSKLAECGLEARSGKLWLTERGTSFGCNTLVVAYLSLPQLQTLGAR